MGSDDQLTLGYIPYLNCVPFFRCLEESGFRGRLVGGVPSELNRLLQAGQLDASPSSSFEYAHHWRDYLILPGHSIASTGPVKSVLLFSLGPLTELAGRHIALTGESATSINLLRILLREFVGLDEFSDGVPSEPVEQLLREHQPALLIGDRALRAAQDCPPDMRIYDLGELWYDYTGLPFVFALWMVRRAALERFADELGALGDQLQRSCTQVLSRPGDYAAAAAQSSGLQAETVIDYWRTIDFRLEDDHCSGLRLFFQLCCKYGYLDEAPDLCFLA